MAVSVIPNESIKHAIPDFSSYSNRDSINTTNAERTYSENRFVIGRIWAPTSSQYAIVYVGNVQVASTNDTGSSSVSFVLKAGTTIKTGATGTYELYCWKVN